MTRGHPSVRLLSVCETARGGVGVYQRSLAILARDGFEISTLVPDSDAETLGDLNRVVVFARKRRSLRGIAALLLGFFRERRRLKPDILFFHSSFALLPLLALRLVGDRTPAVYCAHCWASESVGRARWKGSIIRTLERRLCGLADVIVNVSLSDAEVARRLDYAGVHVTVENAVSEADPGARNDLFQRMDDREIHLLFVGRFDRQKGLDILLPAFEKARMTSGRLHLHLVGGAVRDRHQLPCGAGVIHHGWATPAEIDGFYRSADAIVVPSRWEGMPLVVLEAFRNGTPALISDIAAMQTLVAPGRTGYIFDLEVDALAVRLAALTREDLAAMRSEARHEYERRFSLDRFGRELSVILHELVEGRRDA